ncbi:hypothetical protein HUE46_10495 [Flavobacterium columnare]|uniref:type VI-B CRISPR-associated RNA-guided ribonuclease Cas13b n=1 Tax=Flavobacterium columnare TaxID=996 RepID=UPI001786084B|nr:type VI-B CRISPR-associated RNA-guided ribonuclease Cas13b [Flavobacterium columnare]QOG90389.1 hypothetical protein HUE41_10495 [Flavobacterium columnare]QOG93045.1 hypothetical protein HUE42_10490 [Flavobacterium columnare]QOG95710.1 hypothetical protein HUE43_10490 [Flavobacterium columnare]QOG98370.1 hypothetical protein HUE44_10490 [Flavobacterium columnare]QOH01029.1 hypothetical protein HUE45_10490 [Flavobacterium columnare]
MSSKNESYNKQKTFNHYKQEDKYFFGGFLNNAEENIITSFKEIAKRLNSKEKNKPIEILQEILSETIIDTEWDKNIKVIAEYFPFVKSLETITQKQYEENQNKLFFKERNPRQNFKNLFLYNCIILFNCPLQLRDFYTHFYHRNFITISFPDFRRTTTDNISIYDYVKNEAIQHSAQSDGVNFIAHSIFELLDELKLETVSQVNNQRIKPNEKYSFLKKNYQNDFTDLTEEEISKKFKKVFNQFWTFNDYKGRMVLKDFHKSHFVEKVEEGSMEQKPKKDFFHQKISRSGFLFLLSLFVDRKNAEFILDNSTNFKASFDLQKLATRWVYTYNCYRGLKNTINTTFPKETLLSKMVDYLSKVPDEVYQLLSIEQQEMFLEDMNEYMRDNEENNDSSEASKVVHPVIRKRYSNEFNYLALSFIDQYIQLPNLRFAINLGTYVHNKEEKIVGKGKTSSTSNRVIKEDIRIYARLHEAIDFKNNFFLKENFSEDNKGCHWEEFPNPHYAIKDNNIGIYFINKDDIQTNLEERSNGKKKKASIIEMLTETESDTIKYGKPHALLSCYELIPLIFDYFQKVKNSREKKLNEKELNAIPIQIENKILSAINSFTKSFENYSEGKSILESYPKKLSKTSNETSFLEVQDENGNPVQKILQDINKEIQKSQDKLDILKQNENEFQNNERKAVFSKKEIGEEATWLANDILRFMPSSSKKNWKGYEHSHLQYLLAFYDVRKTEVFQLLNQKWPLYEDNFMGKSLRTFLDNRKTFESFYKGYLDKRKEIFGNLKNNLSLHNENLFRVFDKRKYITQSLESYKNAILEQPVSFSRGIFEDKKATIKNEWSSIPKDPATEYQSFYNLINIYTNEAIGKEEKKEKYKNLRAINKVKIQDYYLKLMVDTLYQDLFNQPLDKSLSDFYVSKAEREKIKADAKAYQKRNDSSLWNKVIHLSLQNNRITANPKLKDIGKYKRALQDEKIATLLTYDDRTWTYALQKPEKENENDYKELHYTALNMELQEYEKVRSKELLKQVQELEKKILDKFYDFSNNASHPEDLEIEDKKGKRHPNFKLYITKALLKNESEIINLENIDIEILLKYYDYNTEELKEKIKNMDEDEKAKIVNTKENYNKITNVLIKKALVLIIIRNKMAHNQYPPKFIYDLATSFQNDKGNKDWEKFVHQKESEYFATYFNRVFETITKELWENKEKKDKTQV